MFEIIYDWLLHIFALIGIILTLVIIVIGRVLAKDAKYTDAEDKIFNAKSDRELHDMDEL